MRRTAFVAAACALSLLFALASLRRGQHGDEAMFQDWYARVRGAPSRAYVTARDDVNYPAIGLALAVAPGVVLAGRARPLPAPRAFEAVGKLLLVPWLALLVVAFAACGSALGIARPRARALAFALLPSTWAVGMWFGQIDAATGALQLLSVACSLRFVAAAWQRDALSRRDAGYLAGALLALVASLLSKQLALFAAPALLALPIAGVLARVRAGHRREAFAASAAVAASLALLRAPDLYFALPAGWHSHLVRVFFIGPAHREQLANAPGLFALIGLRPGETALEPIAFGAAPRTVGLALFVAYALALSALCAWRALPLARSDDPRAVRPLASIALLHGGLCHLAAATLVAGSHERYPFHAFPLLFLAFAARPTDRFARALEALAWLAGAAFGALIFIDLEWTWCAPLVRVVTARRVAALLLGVLVLGLAHAGRRVRVGL